jgi:hypothetical protein
VSKLEPELASALDRLVYAGLLFRQGRSTQLFAARVDNVVYLLGSGGVGLTISDPQHRFMPMGVAAGQAVGTSGWNGSGWNQPPGTPYGASGIETDNWPAPLPDAVAELARDASHGGAVCWRATTPRPVASCSVGPQSPSSQGYGSDCRSCLPNTLIEVWQANNAGQYNTDKPGNFTERVDFHLRGM